MQREVPPEKYLNPKSKEHIDRYHLFYPTGKGTAYDDERLKEHGRAHELWQAKVNKQDALV